MPATRAQEPQVNSTTYFLYIGLSTLWVPGDNVVCKKGHEEQELKESVPFQLPEKDPCFVKDVEWVL